MFESLSVEIDCEKEYDASERDSLGMTVDARGFEVYRSWSSVRPSDITGVVAYIGIRVKRGKCLQQWAKAAKCATVACVRRMIERVGTCLHFVY